MGKKIKKDGVLLTYKGDRSQLLGKDSEGKPIIIRKELTISMEEWNLIKDRKWNQKLMENGFLIVESVSREMNKMKKDIEKGNFTIAE